MIQFGAILIRCRKKAGLSQQQVADRLGVAKSTYHAWESDKSVFSADYLPELATIFGVDITELFPPGLTITVSQPTASGDDLTSTFDARKLYEDVVGLLKRTNQLLETENRLLKERLSRVPV
jgi:transcriptional regulator with XRE-family HTH domain